MVRLHWSPVEAEDEALCWAKNRDAWQLPRSQWRQVMLVTVASLFPLIMNVIYLTGLSPIPGLDLTADLHVYAQPAFTFDISGYVRAKALFWEVYSNRWTLASYRFGSDYRFGIRLPVHYHEGQPFNISLDDVQFEVPDISPSQILSGLIDRIA